MLQVLGRERKVGGQRKWGQACTLEERWAPCGQGVLKCTVQAGMHTFLGISVKFKSRQEKSNPRMWWPAVEKKTTWQASRTWPGASSRGPFKWSTSPGQHLQCWQDRISASLLSCIPITPLLSLSGRSLPVPLPLPPSCPSRLQDRAVGSQQHCAVFPLQYYPCLDYKCLPFPIQLALPSPFYHRDKPRKICTVSFSDDKSHAVLHSL